MENELEVSPVSEGDVTSGTAEFQVAEVPATLPENSGNQLKASISRFDYQPKTDTVVVSPNVEVNEAIDELAEEIKVRGQICIDATAETEKALAEAAPLLEELQQNPELKETPICACDDCLEAADLSDNDATFEIADADGLILAFDCIADLKDRVAVLERKFEDLESRLTQYNIRSSHKI